MVVECLLCLQCDQEIEKCIQVNSTEWKDNNIKKLIDKHLWPIDTIKDCSWLCQPCWEELKDFHKFYNRIEEAHNDFKSLLKSETDPLEEDSKPKDLQLEILLEPEIVIGQALESAIVIKQEFEEPTVIPTTDLIKETNTKSDDILADREFLDDADFDNHGSGYSFDDDDDESESDDDRPLIHRVKSDKTSSKTSTDTKSKDGDSKKDDSDDEDDSDSDSDPDPLQYAGKNKRKKMRSKRSSADKSNMNRKSYYTPKTNRLEHDKFIQEHFKLTCYKCHLPFDTFPLLCKHFRDEHNERGFVNCCEMKFFDRSLLVDHINCHLNPEYFKCKVCGKVLTQRRCLWAHMKLHEEKQFQCDICSKKFVQKSKLERHKYTHLSPTEKEFSCPDCGKFFANKYILTQHQRVVHLNIYAKICEYCGQTIPDSNSFKRHMEKHEMKSEIKSSTPSTTVKCDECGLILAGPLNLKRHRDLQHPVGGKRDYTCHICLKISPNMRALKKHIRCTHEMGYNYKCTMCEKAFKRSDNLKAHMSTHTGTPLYACQWCPKTFNSNGNMHNHRKKAHPVEWEEARRKKYSGNLPPNFKPPVTANNNNYNTSNYSLPLNTGINS